MSRSLYARLARRYRGVPDAPTRRAFLQAAAALGAGSLLSVCSGPRIKRRRPKPGHRVVVIGAGFAGLACAYELASVGVDVHVIEARKRLGGRVLGADDLVPGKRVEAGGELIGSNHPLWSTYARRFGLELEDVSAGEDLATTVLLDGERLSEPETHELFLELEAAYAQMTLLALAIDADEPWKSPRASEFDVLSNARWIADLDTSTTCKRALAAVFTADNGVATARQSLLGQLAMVKGGGLARYWTESEVYRCAQGNASLAAALADGIGSDRVHLGRPVVLVRSRERSAIVITVDGGAWEADEVVLAVAPSVWKRIRFEPALPEGIAPQLGLAVKYVAAVDAPYWRAGGLAAESIGDGEVSLTWDATEGQPGDARAALVAFSGGPPAEACRARSGELQQQAYAHELETLLPGFRAHVTETRMYDWPADPWTACGYSFPAPGEVTKLAPLLRRGIGRVRFSGEHVSSKFPGYMEGALDSGAEVARRIVAGERTEIART